MTVSFTLSQSRPLRYGVFFYLYMMQGIPSGFYLTALANYFTAKGVKPDVVGSFIAIIGLPWAFQFIWGPLIDRFQGSPMGRRKPWVVGSQLMTLLASGILLFVRNPVENITTLAWLFCLRSLFAAIQDASVDAMAITVIPEDERGRVNAFMRAGFLIGTGVGAAVFATILHQYGFHGAAIAQVICLLTGVLLMTFIREKPGDSLWPSFKRGAVTVGQKLSSPARPAVEVHDFRWLFTELFRGLFSRHSVLLFGAIVLAYISSSLFLRAYNYHLIQNLGWADASVSVLTGTYGMIAATIVALTGGWVADRVGPRRLLVVVLGMVAAYLLVFNALSSLWIQRDVAQTGLVALYFMDPGISVAAMPLLMALARPGVEGSQFTTYMAFINLADIAGTFLTGYALTYVSAPTIGLFAGGLAVMAMIIVLFTLRRYRDAGA